MHKSTKACDIPISVKKRVWERDNHQCVCFAALCVRNHSSHCIGFLLRMNFNAAPIDEIVKMYESGQTIGEIARHYGIPIAQNTRTHTRTDMS